MSLKFNPSFVFDSESVQRPPVEFLVEKQIDETPKGSSMKRKVDEVLKNYMDNVQLPDLDSLKEDEGVKSKKIKVEDTFHIKQQRAKKDPKGVDDEVFDFKHTITHYKNMTSFIDFKLNKPLLRALTDMKIFEPTPIQCSCIPIGLLGKDICACARTGSGKTLAFLLPFFEKLIAASFSSNYVTNSTKALIISPTRELAVQIYQVGEKLLKYAPKIEIQLTAGGLNLQNQEASLRKRPDIVVATPGRLIDHLSNAPNFNLSTIEYLVLDEADKLLEENFIDQVKEIIRHCNVRRQTMLFSATMTELVKELMAVSLKDPVRVFLNQSTALATEIHHEFVRIRPNHENSREAVVASVIFRYFPKRTIVFIRTKKECHRMYIILSLLKIKVGELHGDMSQSQRLDTLNRFAVNAENDPIDILVATDLAARGLDIPDVQTVINLSMPPNMKQFVHRVGRTARAKNSGRAVSLIGDNDRKLLKTILKETKYPVKLRNISSEVIDVFQKKIKDFEKIIQEVLMMENSEREIRIANKQMKGVEGGINGDGAAKERKNWFDEQKEIKRVDRRNKRFNSNKNKSKKK